MRLETGDWRLRRPGNQSPVSSLQSPISSLQSLSLLLILVLAAFLRFYQLDGSSLWSDEGNTWALLSRPWLQIAQDAAADIHPPGYYWLLKAWTALWGRDAFGMRSLSALAGLLLVWVIYQLALVLMNDPPRPAAKRVALLAALLAALNPFQIYYSQEARMYLLLALESAGLMWATLRLLALARQEQTSQPADAGTVARLSPWWPALVYVICGAAGLWTHYSFPVVLVAAVAAFLLTTIRTRRNLAGGALRRFLLLNLIVAVLFLPWLPTALARVQAWPHSVSAVGWRTGSDRTLRTLLFGPLRNTVDPPWPWLGATAVLPLVGLWRLRRQHGVLVILCWLLAPIGLMVGLRLFSDAFLKFLLTASPAWCVAVAGVAVTAEPWKRLPGALTPLRNSAPLVIAGAFLLLALLVLPAYYHDPTARDNYAGVARYVRTLGDPADSLVILDAPGQQEVWAYYDPGLPVLALPQQRPPDAAQTLATLAETVAGRRRIFALFWATQEADPDRLVEGWLDQHTFKGVESWQGNLRFVTYTMPGELTCQTLSPAPTFGQQIKLSAVCEPVTHAPTFAGSVLPVALRWTTDQRLSDRYKVTLQLLDGRDQVVAQRDSEPAGGAQPTDGWQPGATVRDNHALLIPFGTPPGAYRLLVALYAAATGERLTTPAGDAYPLGAVTITPAAGDAPLDIIPMQHRVASQLGPVTLVGYDQYHRGFAHLPQTPLTPGDPLHFTLYWQAPDPLPPDWPADLHFTLQLGSETLHAPLAGGAYPTAQWRAGELVRGEFDLTYAGGRQRPMLTVADAEMRLSPLPR